MFSSIITIKSSYVKIGRARAAAKKWSERDCSLTNDALANSNRSIRNSFVIVQIHRKMQLPILVSRFSILFRHTFDSKKRTINDCKCTAVGALTKETHVRNI